jgi:ketosteroid isomerase-like protein
MSTCCGPDRGRPWSLYITAVILCLALVFVVAQGASVTRDESVLQIADRFADALAADDQATVRALLLPNVLIFESGGAEISADEYAGHHLPADIAFMAAIKRTVLSRQSGGDMTTGWVATKARLQGRYKDRDIDLDSTESLVLQRSRIGWRIAHVHWSSSPHPAATP